MNPTKAPYSHIITTSEGVESFDSFEAADAAFHAQIGTVGLQTLALTWECTQGGSYTQDLAFDEGTCPEAVFYGPVYQSQS